MADPRWQRIQEILDAALAMPVSERAAWLDEACAGDESMRREVEGLIAAAESEDDFLESPLSPRTRRPQRLGDFDVLDEIGRGGMGVVYRARQRSLERDVALKVLAASALTSERDLQRFHREPRGIAKLKHPNVVEVIADGVDDDVHWFAMEFVEGGDLQHELERLREPRRPNEPPSRLPAPGTPGHTATVARIVRDVARALHAAHQNGIVHRDVKPANLLLTKDLLPKVVDFGIARDERLGRLTRTHDIAGTPHYMSPEQARLTQEEVDHRTDIYSLGVVLYEMLTLERPFDGPTEQHVRSRILTALPKPPRAINPEVPRDLETICLAAMARAPADRYADAGALADDLHAFLNHRTIAARPPSAMRRARDFVGRHKVAAVAAVLVVLAGVAGFSIARSEARNSVRETLLAEVRTVAEHENWDTIDLPTLIRALASGTYLGARLDSLSGPDAEFVTRTTSDVRSYANRLLEQGLADIESGRAKFEDPAASGVDFALLSRGQQRLIRSSAITGDTSVLARREAEPFLPRLTVSASDSSGNRLEGSVSLLRISELDGIVEAHETELGPLPVRDAPVPAGYHRVVIRFPDGAKREFARYLIPGYWDHAVTCVRRSEHDDVSDMVVVQGGTLRVNDRDELFPNLEEGEAVETFLMDQTEVTVANWREFLQSGPSSPFVNPTHWMVDRITPGSPEDSLPIVGVSWFEAREYAEWKGRRLPTYAEWTWAARGPYYRRFPWLRDKSVSEAPDPPLGGWFGNVNKRRPVSLTSTAEVDLAVILSSLRPVGSDPRGSTPAPMVIHDLFGNAFEWVESFCPEYGRDRPIPRVTRRIALGGDWREDRSEKQYGLEAFVNYGPEDSWTNNGVGFRCARDL